MPDAPPPVNQQIKYMKEMKPLLETLSEILPKEKNVNSGEGLPFENSPEIYGNRRIVAYANGANEMLAEVKLLLPQIIEAVRVDILNKIETTDWKENHICGFNDGAQSCDCMLSVIEVIKNLITKHYEEEIVKKINN